MEVRYSRDPQSFTRMNSAEIRAEFLVTDLFATDAIKLVYSNVDRMIVGSAVPLQSALNLAAGDELRAAYFAERPEYVELLILERAEFKDRQKPTYFVYRDADTARHQEVVRRLIAEDAALSALPESVQITLEPAGGSAVPSGPVVVIYPNP